MVAEADTAEVAAVMAAVAVDAVVAAGTAAIAETVAIVATAGNDLARGLMRHSSSAAFVSLQKLMQ